MVTGIRDVLVSGITEGQLSVMFLTTSSNPRDNSEIYEKMRIFKNGNNNNNNNSNTKEWLQDMGLLTG